MINNPYVPGDPGCYDLEWIVKNLNRLDSTVQSFIKGYGMPIVVDQASLMKDKNKIYIYIGNEPGYTPGDWYYFNEETNLWTSGGAYGGYPVDDALSSTSTNAVQNKVVNAKFVSQQAAIDENSSDIEALSSQIDGLDYPKKALKGKKILLLGDSLAIGMGNVQGHTWLDIINTKYEVDGINYGVVGSKISTGGDSVSSTDMATRIDSILASNPECDIFILEGGANDYNKSVPIGLITDKVNTTFIGAIRNIIAKVRYKYGSACKIIALSPYHRYDATNSIGLTEYDYVMAMMRACADLGIPCFNNYNGCGLQLADNNYGTNPYEWADQGLQEGTTKNYHFSEEAFEYLEGIYTPYILNCYVQGYIEPITVYTDDNGYVWTRRILDDGMTEITCKANMQVQADRYTYAAPIYLSDVLSIAIPDQKFALDTVYDYHIEAQTTGFSWAQFNNVPTTSQIRFTMATAKSSAPGTVNTIFYIRMLGYKAIS